MNFSVLILSNLLQKNSEKTIPGGTPQGKPLASAVSPEQSVPVGAQVQAKPPTQAKAPAPAAKPVVGGVVAKPNTTLPEKKGTPKVARANTTENVAPADSSTLAQNPFAVLKNTP